MNKLFILIGAAIFLGCASSGVERADIKTEIKIRYAVVTNVESVTIKSDVGKNAAIGGVLGLAIGAASGGDIGSAAVGAAAGSAITAITTKISEGSSKATQYTLVGADKSEFKVITEDKHLVIGDCTTVETGRTTNLRRVSQDMCAPPLNHPVEQELVEKHHEDATECHDAKQQLLNAETDADLEAATKKVRVLCQH